MKLYPKQLHSIEELKREKAALELLRKQTDLEDIFSLNDVIPSFTKKNKTEGSSEHEQGEQGDGIMGMVHGLMDSFEIGDLLKVIGGPIAGLAGKKLRNNVILPLAKEVVGGYLKWKAAELSVKAVKHFLKARKEKKNKEHKE